MNSAFLIGRVIFGGFFLYNGINHFKQRKALAAYAEAKNTPLPEQAVLASGVLLALGGAAVIMGLKPKLGAAAIMAFLGTVSPMIHDFWNASDPQARQNDLIHFSKNVALLAAALTLTGVPEPWPASVTKH